MNAFRLNTILVNGLREAPKAMPTIRSLPEARLRQLWKSAAVGFAKDLTPTADTPSPPLHPPSATDKTCYRSKIQDGPVPYRHQGNC